MKKSFPIGILSLSASAALWLAPHAGATGSQIIIQDGFSGTTGTSDSGRTPDTTDLPTSTWSIGYVTTSGNPGHSQIFTGAGNPAPGSYTGSDCSTWLSIASGGSYTKPTGLITESVDLEMLTLNGTDFVTRGIGLGYFASAPINNVEQGGNGGFTGLLVKPNGTLSLFNDGTQTAASVAAFGGFSASSFYNLNFTVDTNTGSITSVFFNGNNDTATFSGAASAGDFTNAVTNLAGFYGSTAGSTLFQGVVDNFVVAPEPSAWMSMVGGLGILVGFRRFGRKCAA